LNDIALSHPHVFIDCQLTVVFNERGLAGIKQRWSFDEMFSDLTLEEFDANENMQFEPDEIKGVKTGFDNLRGANYLTHILIDGKETVIQDATSFSAEISELGKTIFSFFIPCPLDIDAKTRQILISIFDDTYYIDVVLLKEEITYENQEKFGIEKSVRKIPEFTYYYGQIIPEGLSLTCQAKKEKKKQEKTGVISRQDNHKDKTDGALGKRPVPYEPQVKGKSIADSKGEKGKGKGLSPQNRDKSLIAEQTQPSINPEKQRARHVGFIQTGLALIVSWQKALKEYLVQSSKTIRENPYGKSFWLFLGFSFAYGVIHALGPGHGKSIVVAYFLSRPGNYPQGILLGNTLTFVHVFSAVTVVLIFQFVLEGV